MKSLERKEALHGISDVLERVRRKGVRLWSENGQLRYKAPRGALSEHEIEELRSVKDQIVAVLEETKDTKAAEPRFESRQSSYSAPLAFSQLAYWNVYQLKERRSQWFPAFAIRLRGLLTVEALQMSFAKTIRHHHALRTRMVINEGVLQQEIVFPGDCAIHVDDLMRLPASFREAEMHRLIKELVSEPIDVLSGPLLRVRLIRLTEDDHVLVVALEHIVSDGVSMNILLQDLLLAYGQAVQGRVLELPEVPVQFADYALHQQSVLSSWIKKHGAYWDKHLAGCQRLRFPKDKILPTTAISGTGVARITIDGKLKAELHKWSRQRQTTIVMSIFTAYVGLVLRWCNVSDAVFLYQIDGRVWPELERTVGLLASVLYLRVTLSHDDNFVMLLNRVTEEYCHAYDHADFSYIASQVPTPEFVRNSCFNWRPNSSSSGRLQWDESQEVITCSEVVIDRQMDDSDVDIEPTIGLIETVDGIEVTVEFSRKHFFDETMERFGRNLLMFVMSLVGKPEQRVKGLPIL